MLPEGARDRIRAEADCDVNLRAELLLEHLTQAIEAVQALLADGREEQA
jgi:hypothetical protein